MHPSLIWSITLILALAVSAQWIAWRIGLPSILLLLVIGLVAGPVAKWISPDAIFGDLLYPFVSISVGLILYEGGLSLVVGVFSVANGVKHESGRARHDYLRGQRLFSEDATYASLISMMHRDFEPKMTRMSEAFDYAAYLSHHGDSALPIFVIENSGRLRVVTADSPAAPKIGENLISLVRAQDTA